MYISAHVKQNLVKIEQLTAPSTIVLTRTRTRSMWSNQAPMAIELRSCKEF